jgi:hypothetical protein
MILAERAIGDGGTSNEIEIMVSKEFIEVFINEGLQFFAHGDGLG